MAQVSESVWFNKPDFRDNKRPLTYSVAPSGYSKFAKEVITRGYRSRYDNDRCNKTGNDRSVVGSVVTHTDKGRTNSSANDYRLGDIIRVPHVAPSLNPRSTLGESHVGYINNTGPVIGKLRPSIVVAVYKNNMTCLPICSAGGRGFCFAAAEHCVMLRGWQDDHRAWDDCQESEYVMVAHPFKPVSGAYINLTDAFSVSYRCPIAVTGRLTTQSFERLKKMWMIVIDKGGLPIGEQQSYAKLQIRKIPITGEYEKLRRAELTRIAKEREAEREKEKEKELRRSVVKPSHRRSYHH